MNASVPSNFPDIGFYQHYKHDPAGPLHNYMYEVVGFARNTEDKTFSVLYRPLYENDWFQPATYQSRPLTMFVEQVEKGGVTMPRFKKVAEEALVAELIQARDNLYSV